jgi:hypothetical protein
LGTILDLGEKRAHAGDMRAEPTEITAGDEVVVIDAGGREHTMTAHSRVETEGHDFPVVWVRRPLQRGGTDLMPWPAEYVRPNRG